MNIMRGIIMRTWLVIYGVSASLAAVAYAYLLLLLYTVISQERRLPFAKQLGPYLLRKRLLSRSSSDRPAR